MATFYQTKTRVLKPEPENQPVIKNCCGFTLIELLAVISTVAVLIALLLPVIQKKREEYAANKAGENITALMVASTEYFRRIGSYPTAISDLFQFCSANPGLCSLDPQLASGKTGGYLYTLTKTGTGTLEFEAEPEIPGITGSITHTYDSDLRLIASTPTPGSDAARQRAFDNILASGAATVVQLLNMDSTGDATSQVRSYTGATAVNAGVLTSVFSTLDTNHDGTVSVSEVNATDNTLGSFSPALKGFLDTVSRELRLETLSAQELQDISVSFGDVDGDRDVDVADYLFSYEGLRNLTKTLVPDFNNDLIAKLDAAEVVEANGNLNRKAKLLKQYRQLVKAQKRNSLTGAQANTLITIAKTL